MANIEKIKYTENEPFLTYVDDILKDKLSESKIIKVLEIGCGPGDFSLIFKDKYKNKVDLIAIDPSDDIEKAMAKSIGSDVQFERGDIFTYKTDQKFDVVIFTKSLHHCNPVDKAVQLASDLLHDGGIFIAEELTASAVDEASVVWFFDRLDLIRTAGCMISFEERLKNGGYATKMLTKFLDSSLPATERWPRKVKSQDQHVERGGPDDIAPNEEVRNAINNTFGENNVAYLVVPFYYFFLAFAGLKNNEDSEATLKEFMKQERRAIDSKEISAFGLYISSQKK